ncbi:efflux RND transporter periplasmic adaptor subunit [Muriicola marianensis]|nr:efflux RND transporter periplasmic adaptor subunit [Muriicola marianensis]
MSRNVLFTCLILAAILPLGCKNKVQETEPGNGRSEEMITLSTVQFDEGQMQLGSPEERDFPNIVQATGMIDVPPQNKAVVSAILGGYIKETPLLIGDEVKKGQTLLVLENPEFISLQQEYLKAGQDLKFLESDYERQKQLLAENISSQKSFLKAESEYKGNLARYSALKEKLLMLNFSLPEIESGTIRSTSRIFSPISGSVTKINVSKGMYVSPADEIMEITDNDHIHLELNVFEKDIMKLSKEQPIHFTIPEASDEVFEAQVYLIGTHIEANRTVKVHAHLKEEDHHRFLTGMFVEAGIITSQDKKLSLPDAAIAGIDDTNYVLRLVEKKDDGYVFEKVRIETGQSYGGFTSVEFEAAGDEDETYLVQGAFSLLSNAM